MSLPKPLMFTVGLIDQITKPIAKISQRLNGLAANYQAGTMQMATGIGGIAASGFALQNALMPAIEMDRALGEVSSLGVRDSALKMLAQNSYEYALKYGESAVDFVRSSYDIQSAISGLNDADLSRFTMASNVLAKGTKADAATITNYMGTMYGIFSKDAERMGKGAWIERLTGMTATAVQDFKTDGKKMSDAFGALGAAAGLAPLEEQMAIMGKLQATMQGSESATKYKAFLAGVGKAQSALNLQFADANGNMLPMVDILNKIKGKFGETISVAEGDQLAKAFGSQEAVALVKLLLNDIDGLSGSINKLGQVKGMEQAQKMAAAMTDQSQRLAKSWFVIRAAFGSAVLPAFNEFVGKMANMGAEVLAFTDKFPNITRWLGYLGIGFMLAVAAGGLFTLMMGAGKMAIVMWNVVAGICTGVLAALTWAFKLQNWIMLRNRLGWIAVLLAVKAYNIAATLGTAATWLFGVAGKAVTATIWLFGTALKAARWAMAALNVVMLANPIGLIIAGIAAAVVSVGALIYYWDEVKATMSEWGWVQAIGDVFANMINGIQKKFVTFYNWVAEKLNYLPWVEIELKPIVEPIDTDKLNSATKLPANLPNQQALPNWMQQKAANDPVSYVYAAAPKAAGNQQPVLTNTLSTQLNVQRNLPKAYQPEPLTQQQYVQLVKPSEYTPKAIEQQINMQRNLPEPYKAEQITQQVAITPVANESLSNMITPKLNQQAAASAQAKRATTNPQNSGRTLSFGDVIIQNPPKNFSLAELADQQELLTA